VVRPEERGFALLIVVVALAVLGGLGLGAFAIGRREMRLASELGYAAQAFEAAEAGLAVASAGAAAFAAAPPLVPQAGAALEFGGIGFSTSVLRLNESLYLLSSEGRRLDGGGGLLARRSLGLIGRIVTPPDSAAPRFQPLSPRGWVQPYR
jgi:hypothetical protein